MPRTRVFLVCCILLTILVGVFLVGGTARAASLTPKITCKQWNYVSSPNPGLYGDGLWAVTAISASDVWAVGSQYNNYDNTLAQAEQYDGTQWNAVSMPNPTGSIDTDLSAVAAVSSSDVWAVGSYFDSSSYTDNALIEQWNGTSWSIIPSPNEGTNDVLWGIAIVSATNIWAVGSYLDSSSYTDNTLTEQWNGSAWNIVSSPNVIGSNNDLFGVAAFSNGTVWAVGYSSGSSGESTLVEKWNGSVWSIVSSPNVTGQSSSLNNIAAVSGKDLWANGYTTNSSGQYSTLFEQWNGTSWSIVSSPTPSSTAHLSVGEIAAISASNVWSVGWDEYTTGKILPLIEHWNGTRWNLVAGAKTGIGSGSNALYGITRVPGTATLWAVGQVYAVPNETLTEYYC